MPAETEAPRDSEPMTARALEDLGAGMAAAIRLPAGSR